MIHYIAKVFGLLSVLVMLSACSNRATQLHTSCATTSYQYKHRCLGEECGPESPNQE